MIKIIFIIALNLILSLVQTSFFGELVDNNFIPNLVLAFSFALLFSDLNKLALMNAFVGGIMLDLLGFNIIGVSALIMVGSLYLTILVRRHISKGWFVNVLTFFLSLFTYSMLVENLGNFEITRYLVFLLLMLLVLVIFYFTVDSVVNYLRKIGVSIEE